MQLPPEGSNNVFIENVHVDRGMATPGGAKLAFLISTRTQPPHHSKVNKGGIFDAFRTCNTKRRSERTKIPAKTNRKHAMFVNPWVAQTTPLRLIHPSAKQTVWLIDSNDKCGEHSNKD